MSLAERLLAVQRGAADAAARAGRRPDDVVLVGVSKTVGRETIDAAYAAGLRHFGENRVQDALAKLAAPPLPADATVHLIGQLQTNKARPAVGLFGMVESVDRPSLVEALAKEADRAGRRLPVLLQVNVAGEAQKAGCPPAESAALVARIAAAGTLDLRGLMTIAPLVADPEETRPVFRGLRELRDDLRDRSAIGELPVLSMGMTNDYAVAIEEGATAVRIGRAIFG